MDHLPNGASIIVANSGNLVVSLNRVGLAPDTASHSKDAEGAANAGNLASCNERRPAAISLFPSTASLWLVALNPDTDDGAVDVVK